MTKKGSFFTGTELSQTSQNKKRGVGGGKTQDYVHNLRTGRSLKRQVPVTGREPPVSLLSLWCHMVTTLSHWMSPSFFFSSLSSRISLAVSVHFAPFSEVTSQIKF